MTQHDQTATTAARVKQEINRLVIDCLTEAVDVLEAAA